MSSITINMNDAASMLNGLKALLPTLEKMVSATQPSLAAVTEKKRVGKPLTEEHKAKMKAGREAKKAEKAALALTPSTALAALTAVAPVTEAEKPKRVLTEEHLAKMKAGREAKKAEKAALATAPSTVVEAVTTEAPSTATAVATEAEKPKRVGKPLTEEHKAKLKAGREAAKAKKEAEKAALTATVPAPTVVTEAPKESEGELSDSGSAGSKRGRPKGSKNKPKTEEEKAASKAKKLSKLELAASIPLPSSPVASPENVISIKGRLFVVDSNNNAYTCIGTKERGEYVGRYDKNSQIIDDSLDAN